MWMVAYLCLNFMAVAEAGGTGCLSLKTTVREQYESLVKVKRENNMDSILAIDQGTTNSKAILVEKSGEVIPLASRSLTVSYPRPAWVEQDPLAIWQSIMEVIQESLQNKPDLAALGISNQRESVVLWERESGNAVGPCVVWQCQRGAALCQELKAQRLEPIVRERTGLPLDPMFSTSKMRWLLDNTENGHARAAAGELCLGTIDSWLLFKLTGGRIHACDMTNASRTQLFNLHELQWDDELLSYFDIPAAALPQVRPSSYIYGETMPLGNLPGGIPIAALIGDSHAALFGHAGFQPGSIKATYGTGSSLMTPTARPITSQNGLATTIAWAQESGVTYALEGNIYITGAAVQWLGQLLGLTDAPHKIEALANSVPDTDSVYFVPAFVGLGAPHWNDSVRGLITGLTRGTTAAHLARATLESIAYQIKDVFDVMQAEADTELQMLLADGGPSQNSFLMQFQADIIDCPVSPSLTPVVSALGAAYLAGLAAGLWASETEIAELPRSRKTFESNMQSDRRNSLYAGWKEAIQQATCGAKPERK
jgi:glycerol kinase